MTRRTTTLLGPAVLALAVTAGCGAEETDRPQAGRLTVATFNAGLARGDVDYAGERVAPVSAALAALEVDLLCVQEYWEDWDALAQAATALPNRVHQPPMSDCPAGACTMADLQPLIECGEPHGCDQLEGEAMLACMSDSCMDRINGTPAPCVACIIQSAGAFQDVIDACVGADSSGESFLYGCGYDTGILTRKTILEQESRELDSFLVKAGVDYARIDADGGEVDVFCTHLQSEMDFVYAGQHGTYEDEQSAQIDQLLAFIAERSDGTRPVVLLGDLNTGPDIPTASIAGEWPDHYERLLAAELGNPCVALSEPPCSLCPENTFRSDDSARRLIDHILVRNARSDATCSPIMTETISLTVEGGEIQSNYSDHYGLATELSAS